MADRIILIKPVEPSM